MELSALLSAEIVLPSVPKVIALLMSELRREPPDLRQITQLVSTDPVLTVRVLQAANAPQGVGDGSLSGKVHSAAEALALLDSKALRRMVDDAASSVSLRSVPGIHLPQFWAYSLDVARLSRALAGLTRQNPGAAFTCGLIHGIGELVMHAGMPGEMAELDARVAPLELKRAKAEMQAFDYTYAQVGAAYARQWHFPGTIVDALEHQYAPFSGDVYEPLAGVIHLATWRARAMEARLDDRALAVTFPGAVGEVLDLDIDMVLQQDPFDWHPH
jgi:HD-like signal output (HDOD) protein